MRGAHHHRGVRIRRGRYHGTTDDRADRWYVDAIDGNLDRTFTGRGRVSVAYAHIPYVPGEIVEVDTDAIAEAALPPAGGVLCARCRAQAVRELSQSIIGGGWDYWRGLLTSAHRDCDAGYHAWRPADGGLR